MTTKNEGLPKNKKESSDINQEIGLERMLFFSDAVFAIAITLLALELKLPALEQGKSERDLQSALLAMLPVFIGFVLSFILIGQAWIEHHRIGGFLTKTDRGLLWLNLLLLMFVALMPFATSLVSEYYYSNTVVALYASVFGLIGLCKAFFWRRAKSKNLVEGDAPALKDIGRRVWISPAISMIVVVLSALGVPYGYLAFLLIPLVARFLSD